MDGRRKTGTLGEAAARRYLEEKGWLIRETNWRTRLGELDIIADQKGSIVIVEVRTTRGTRFGYGFQSVDGKKQQKVRRLALQYVKSHRLENRPLRIDVISVLLAPSGEVERLDHLEGAF
ncbi:YraN family protein [Salinithrix halophila]|uniref:UPF0102 protein ACFOUO_06255 n=1 Tax=Salinithrix halophila TaxID=1485204 RepID=A0ABV8JKB5_9BACL